MSAQHQHQGQDQDQHQGQHHHPHQHGGSAEDFDWDVMGAQLEREAELRAPFVAEAAGWLRGLLLEDGREEQSLRRLLDVGSGPGATTAQLAQVFPYTESVAVDGSAALLVRARERAERLGLSDRLLTLEAELPRDVADMGTADIVWAANSLHHIGDQQAALDALAGTVRPGGLLAVVEHGLPLRFLPRDIGIGRPGFQARLDVASGEWFTEMRAGLPGHKDEVEDWRSMLARTGLTPAGTRSFVVDLPAPLAPAVREHLHAVMARTRDNFADRLDADDVTVLDALLDEDAPTGLLRRPDVFYLSATTVCTARRSDG